MDRTKKRNPSFTLLTNVEFMQETNSGARLRCNALLITEDDVGSFFGPRYSIRGFGTSSSLEHFSIALDKDALPFKIVPGVDSGKSMVTIQDGGKPPKPLFSGCVLELANGKSYFLQAEDASKPLDIHQQRDGIGEVWDLLENKVLEYWTKPFIVHAVWLPHGLF